MTKEQEAQQAQTIAEIKAIRNGGEYPRVYYREAIDKALEIVDSQAQKIKSLESELRASKSALDVAAELLPKRRKEIAEQAQTIAINAAYAIELQGKIAEQAKRILELEIEAAEHVCSLDNNGR